MQDANGRTVASAGVTITVALSTNAPGGKLFGSVSSAAVNGVATFTNLSVDRTGNGYTLIAAGSNVASAISVPFNIVAAAAAKLVFATQPTGASAGDALAPAVTVKVLDAYDNVVASANNSLSISLSPNPNGGTLLGTTIMGALNGVATFANLSVDRTGNGYTLIALGPNQATAISAPFNIVAGGAAKLAFGTQPTGAFIGAALAPAVTVKVLDAYDNVVTSATNSLSISLAANPNGGTLLGTTTVSAVNGVATFSNLRIDRSGSGYTLAVASTTLGPVTSSAFTIVSALPSALQFVTQPSNAVAGTPIQPAIRVAVTDSMGNIVGDSFSRPVSLTLTHPSFSLKGITTVASVNGVATFSDIALEKSGSGWRVRADADGLSSALSAPFTITAAPATYLAVEFEAPNRVKPGQTFVPPISIGVHDTYGNRVVTATDKITISIADNPTGAVLSGTLNVDAINGLATFSDLSIDKLGMYSLGFSAVGLRGVIYIGFYVVP